MSADRIRCLLGVCSKYFVESIVVLNLDNGCTLLIDHLLDIIFVAGEDTRDMVVLNIVPCLENEVLVLL